MGHYNNLVNRKFSRLRVMNIYGTLHGYKVWSCRCDCGNVTNVTSYNLTSGTTKSCGCLGNEARSKFIQSRIKHGDCKSNLYSRWESMRQRCNNKNNIAYRWYGGKGVTVCSEWNDYNNFKEWALSNGFHESLTIDRINPNGNYEPSNCRWVTMTEQGWNKTNNIKLDGKTFNQWDIEPSLNYKIIKCRLDRGWNIYEAISVPKTDFSKGIIARSSNYKPPQSRLTHGDSQTKLHGVWMQIKNKCDQWKDYSKFKFWALHSGYQEGLCLIKPRNGEPCSSDNCYWGTKQDIIKITLAYLKDKKIKHVSTQ